MLHSIETGFEENIWSSHELLEVIHSAKKGELHPSLLTPEQLEPIFRNIPDHAVNLDFPIPGPQVNVEELVTFAKVTILCKNGSMRIVMDIPMLDRTDYSIYQMHPLPVIQSVLKNGTGRAYIHTKYNYIAMENSQRTYTLLKSEELKTCKQHASKYIFNVNLKIFETSKRPSCESHMLTPPSMDSLRTCDVRIKSDVLPNWTYLNTIMAWLYSIVTKVTTQVVCPNQ